jgi:hypothetical protein
MGIPEQVAGQLDAMINNTFWIDQLLSGLKPINIGQARPIETARLKLKTWLRTEVTSIFEVFSLEVPDFRCAEYGDRAKLGPADILAEITRATQYSEECLLAMGRKDGGQSPVIDKALSVLGEWLAVDIHRIREAFE